MNLATSSYWPADTTHPVLETTVGSVLRDAADAAPDRTAIVAWALAPGQRRTWTYAALLRDAERAACALLARFAPGEHIAVYAPNCAEWLLLELGAGLAGMVLVTVNPACRARELDYILRQSRSAGLFHVMGFRGNPMSEWVEQVRPQLPDLRKVFRFEDWEEFIDVPGHQRTASRARQSAVDTRRPAPGRYRALTQLFLPGQFHAGIPPRDRPDAWPVSGRYQVE
jgi:fatty-acyl-CoA synthase